MVRYISFRNISVPKQFNSILSSFATLDTETADMLFRYRVNFQSCLHLNRGVRP